VFTSSKLGATGPVRRKLVGILDGNLEEYFFLQSTASYRRGDVESVLCC